MSGMTSWAAADVMISCILLNIPFWECNHNIADTVHTPNKENSRYYIQVNFFILVHAIAWYSIKELRSEVEINRGVKYKA